MTSGAEPQRERDTQVLLDRVRRGDKEAWEQLDQRHRGTLNLVLRRSKPRREGSRFETEDLVQSAFLVAYDKLDEFEYDGKGSFESWLVRIVTNKLKSQIRHHSTLKRDTRRERDLSQSGLVRASTTERTPSQIVANAEQKAKILMFIGELPEQEAEILTRAILDGQRQTDVAADLGLPITTVSRTVAKLVGRLQRHLKADPES